MSIQEEQCRQRLVLGGRGDTTLNGETRQERLNFLSSHLSWMTLAVEKDESPNPSDILLLRSGTVMPKAHALANLVKQSPFCHAVIARELFTVYRCSTLVNTDSSARDNLHIWRKCSISLPHLVRRIIVRPVFLTTRFDERLLTDYI
jgi:hypothetical protein